MMKLSVLKCSYCGRKYRKASAWLYKHFENKHPGEPRKVKRIIIETKEGGEEKNGKS